MGIVNALRFSQQEGAMISDEEFLFQDRRRTFFQDSIQDMLSAEVKKKHNVELWYGGTGYPSFHFEVVQKARQKLAKKLEANIREDKSCSLSYEWSREIMSCIHEITKSKLNQVLQMLFGFTSDDFHRGFYEKNGKRYNISQPCVCEKALEILSGKDKNSKIPLIFKSRALTMGYDPEDGVQIFYANVENQVLSFNSGGYDTIGYGIYAAGQVFANYMRRKNLANRLQGYNRVEAMAILIESALVASQTYRGIGGYFHILYIDGNSEKKARLINVQRSKFASEVVDAHRQNFLEWHDSLELIESAIFQETPLVALDEKLFQKSKKPKELEMYLRGYRVDTSTPDPKTIVCEKNDTPQEGE